MSALKEPASASLAARLAFQVRLFFIALQFFTRLPIPRWVGFEPHWLHQASRYFPAVGLVVGAVAAGTYLVAATVLPQVIAVLLSTAAGIYLTGAFHEDGFADVCDGFGGGMTRERVLEIMTDSRIGAYGAIGIGLLLAMKIALLASLPAIAVAPALLVAHAWSRVGAAALIWRLAYVKGEGKAKPLAQRMSGGEFALGVAIASIPLGAVLVLGLLSWQGVLAGLATLALSAACLARMFVRRISGYTGDCLGAVQQLAEVAFYLALLAVLH